MLASFTFSKCVAANKCACAMLGDGDAETAAQDVVGDAPRDHPRSRICPQQCSTNHGMSESGSRTLASAFDRHGSLRSYFPSLPLGSTARPARRLRSSSGGGGARGSPTSVCTGRWWRPACRSTQSPE